MWEIEEYNENHGFNRFNGFLFDHEFYELNELFAFLAKAPSGWFPKSRQGSPNS